MKYISLLMAASIGLLAGCSQIEQDIADVNSLSDGDLVEKVIFEVLPIKDGDNLETRASAVPDGGTVSFAWEENDMIGIYPNKGSQIYFTIEDGAGSSSATFDGGGWALKQNASYVSYYPFVADFFLSRDEIPVSFAGQKQVGIESPFNGARYFLATEPTSSENGVLRFSYKTLNTIINVNATLPGGTYTKISLTTEEPLFIEEGTYSLDEREIVGTKFSNTLEIDLENVTLTQEGVLPIYIMSAPVDLKGKEVAVRIISSDGKKYECVKTPSRAYEAGTRYGLTCDNMDVAETTKNYLSFTSEEDGSTISLVNYGSNLPNVEYSFNGLSWTIWDYSEIVLNSDETVYMRGNNENGFSSSTEDYYTTDYSTFIMTGSIAANGNIMSLLYSDDFDSHDSIPAKSCFYYLFNGATSLTSAPELPALSLSSRCYSGMFQGCTSLLDAPNLPATELASQCYQLMFNGCCNLIKAPVISSMKMEYDCCNAMFMNCTSLEAAPELPATELEGLCYSNMFMGCTSLVTAPNLPATELASDCYQYMFHGCVSLLYAPSLPATVLAGGCYYGMFIGCTSLTTAPELPATMLQYQCYWYMFDGCSNLSYIKMLATDISASGCLSGWVRGVSSSGVFVQNETALWTYDSKGDSSVPRGWIIEGRPIQLVDLGLSVLWANMNLGSVTQEDYGLYFAWGETTPKKYFNWPGYKFGFASDKLTKYCPDPSYGNNGYTDDLTTLEPSDDAANVLLGGDYRIPTSDEMRELMLNTTREYCTVNSVKGVRLTSTVAGYTNNSIFLPAAGDYNGYDNISAGTWMYYFSSSLWDYPYNARGLSFMYGESGVPLGAAFSRERGTPIRPVCNK